MKKGLIGLLVLALAMTFGLGAMAETTSDETVDCYAISVMAGGAAWGAFEKGFNLGCEELGWNAYYLAPQQANDSAEMVTMIETALNNGADVIMCAFNDLNMFSEVIERCSQSGVPTVGLYQEAEGIDCWIGSDSAKMGSLMADAIVEVAGDNPINVLYLQTTLTHQQQNIQYKAIADRLAEIAPDAVVLGQDECNSNNVTAASKLAALKLANPAFNCCINGDGNGTVGCAAFVEEQGLQGKFFSVGIDDSPEILRLIKEGSLSCTITQGFYDSGYTACYLADKLLKGEEVEYYTPSENLIIFADDVDAYCEQYGIDLSSVD